MRTQPSTPRLKLEAVARTKSEEMRAAIRKTIRSIPQGKVATYGQVAEAAGYPRYHRQVAQILNQQGDRLPWHRVLGSGGQLKIGRAGRLEQRMLLEMEGVRFRGTRVDMKQHEHDFGVTSGRKARRDI